MFLANCFFKDLEKEFDNIFTKSVLKDDRTCPNANIYNFKDLTKIVLEMPGVEKNNVSIQSNEDGVLEIKGKTTYKDFENLTYKQIYCKNFYRSFNLSKEHDKENITAKLENGILEICVPIKSKTNQKQIEIKIN